MNTLRQPKQQSQLLIAIFIIALMISGLVIAQEYNHDPVIHTDFEDIQWQPCDGLEGCEFIILRGDPETQSTDQIWRLQGGTEFPAHYHISPEHIVGVSGELVFVTDGEEVRVGSGDFLYSPSHMTHVGFCEEGDPCVYFVYDEFPIDFNLIEGSGQ